MLDFHRDSVTAESLATSCAEVISSNTKLPMELTDENLVIILDDLLNSSILEFPCIPSQDFGIGADSLIKDLAPALGVQKGNDSKQTNKHVSKSISPFSCVPRGKQTTLKSTMAKEGDGTKKKETPKSEPSVRKKTRVDVRETRPFLSKRAKKTESSPIVAPKRNSKAGVSGMVASTSAETRRTSRSLTAKGNIKESGTKGVSKSSKS